MLESGVSVVSASNNITSTPKTRRFGGYDYKPREVDAGDELVAPVVQRLHTSAVLT